MTSCTMIWAIGLVSASVVFIDLKHFFPQRGSKARGFYFHLVRQNYILCPNDLKETTQRKA